MRVFSNEGENKFRKLDKVTNEDVVSFSLTRGRRWPLTPPKDTRRACSAQEHCVEVYYTHPVNHVLMPPLTTHNHSPHVNYTVPVTSNKCIYYHGRGKGSLKCILLHKQVHIILLEERHIAMVGVRSVVVILLHELVCITMIREDHVLLLEWYPDSSTLPLSSMVQNGLPCFSMVQYVLRWSSMVQYVLPWSSMV